ncbi:TPA: HAMP domain-containing protein [bacterium]|nr:HAMP domain-containing protein [bacterium]
MLKYITSNIKHNIIRGMIIMQISKFQLKITLIFLIVLIVPATISIFLTQYILTIEKRTGIDVDKKVEEVLLETSSIAYDIIDKEKEECKSIAQAISEEISYNINVLQSKDKLRQLIKDIMPMDHHIDLVIFDVVNDTVIFTSSTDDSSLSSDITQKAKSLQGIISEQEGEIIYGIASVSNNNKHILSVIIYKKLEQGLVTSIMDLKNLLGFYAYKEEYEKISWIIMFALVIALAVLGTLLSTILARSVTKPILDLVSGTKEIAKGNLDYRVQVNAKDEIATLVESFNLMTSQLKASRERLMITERLSAWRDVARQIAHEIKNLLSPIQLSMYRLKKNLGSDRYNEIFEQSYESITNEVENLKNMITEFSNFARMPKPRTRPAHINKIIDDAISLYTGLPDNIKIQKNLAENLPQLMVDADQIRQVLHNLISNAIDAMPEGGQLILSTKLDEDGYIVMQVKDNGCGMSEEVRQKIFTPYFTTKEKGTGLGMSIVAQTIEEHEGIISIESIQGVGTIITIRLKSGITEKENEI